MDDEGDRGGTGELGGGGVERGEDGRGEYREGDFGGGGGEVWTGVKRGYSWDYIYIYVCVCVVYRKIG